MRALFLTLLGTLCVPLTAHADVCRNVFVKCVGETGNPPSCSKAYKTCQANPPGTKETPSNISKILEKPVTWKLKKSANPHDLDVIIENPNEFWVKQPNISIEFTCQNGTTERMHIGPSLLVDHIGTSSGDQPAYNRSVCISQGGPTGFKSVLVKGVDARADQVMFLEYGATMPADKSCRNMFPCDGSQSVIEEPLQNTLSSHQTCKALIHYRDNELATQMKEAFKIRKLAHNLQSLWKDREADTVNPDIAQQVRLAERSIRILDAIAEFISGFTPDGGLLKDAAESSSKFVKTVAILDETKTLLDETALVAKLTQASNTDAALEILKSEAAIAAKVTNAFVFRKYQHVRAAVNMNISSLETVKKIAEAKESDDQWEGTVEMLRQSMNKIDFEIKKWTDEIERANLEIRLVNEIKSVIDETCQREIIPFQ